MSVYTNQKPFQMTGWAGQDPCGPVRNRLQGWLAPNFRGARILALFVRTVGPVHRVFFLIARSIRSVGTKRETDEEQTTANTEERALAVSYPNEADPTSPSDWTGKVSNASDVVKT
ncbi:hypothetical protein CEXT_443881 [Caerostris extrusa]|uniref:Uncharacterized protein n=1 Tax=Caerostris extrusa TaxID=172846 RepID=A0AAV4N6V9_CAEEX|nr:hypothetical protein CEXT_443881 [Caerostris extrusa]